jgi:peroxiredoxin
LKELHSKYKDQGLVIIGNHYPEFSYERELDNVKDAVDRLGIEYAVAQDNEGKTWRAYKNHYWPTLYLIDKQGHIRYVHIGEGRYEETEQNVRALLAEEY